MSQGTEFTIDGVKIKTPSSFDMSYYTETKSLRTADGNMQMEFIANKRRFNFKYNAIGSNDLDKIVELLWTSLATTRQCFHTFSYLEGTKRITATVYAGSIPKKLHRGDGSNWVWKDVSFALIEQ